MEIFKVVYRLKFKIVFFIMNNYNVLNVIKIFFYRIIIVMK